MLLEFTKMHAIGNDFVIVDRLAQQFKPDADVIRHMGDRRFGIGCDQVLVIGPPLYPEADFRYQIFNADGSEAEQCGNGLCCAAIFVHRRGLSRKRRLLFHSLAGSFEAVLTGDDQVEVDLGVPCFDPKALPRKIPEQSGLEYELRLPDDERVCFGALGVGNPHAVFLVDDLENAEVERLGALLQEHYFLHGGNVGFCRPRDPHHVGLRVYERGAGETLACGSGACAAVAYGRSKGVLAQRVEVEFRRGTLLVEWQGAGYPVRMCAPVSTAFEGRLAL